DIIMCKAVVRVHWLQFGGDTDVGSISLSSHAVWDDRSLSRFICHLQGLGGTVECVCGCVCCGVCVCVRVRVRVRARVRVRVRVRVACVRVRVCVWVLKPC